MNAIELAPVFRRAAEVIETNGHCKGFFYDPIALAPVAESAACAVGAICVAVDCEPAECYEALTAGGESLALVAVDFLSKHIYSNVVDSDPIERVADWNDADDRTASEVVQALHDAAAAAELAVAA